MILLLVTRGQPSCSGGQKEGRELLAQRQDVRFLKMCLKSHTILTIRRKQKELYRIQMVYGH